MAIDPSALPAWVLWMTLALLILIIGGLAGWARRRGGTEPWWRRTGSSTGEEDEPDVHTRHQWE